MMRWYVVHTQSGAEAMAQGHLERQGFEAYLPRYRKTRRHARRTTEIRAPLFPRYLFVRFDIARTRWRSINGTYGVDQLVCMGVRPSPAPRGVVADIKARENAAGVIELPAQPAFHEGEVLRVTAGPLADQTGVFACMDEQQRVVLLLTMLGREMEVPVRRDAIAAYA
jgi:transcriptional antiterminator RfaH